MMALPDLKVLSRDAQLMEVFRPVMQVVPVGMDFTEELTPVFRQNAFRKWSSDFFFRARNPGKSDFCEGRSQISRNGGFHDLRT